MTTPIADFNQQVIREFRANHGRVGGMFAGARLILLTTTGARTGRPHTTPVGFLPAPGRLLVIASAGGADRHPAWYHNLVADPRVTVETGRFTLEADAVVLEGAEREEIWARAVESDPGWAEYQRKTARVIPVVALRPVRYAGPADNDVTGPDTLDTVLAALAGMSAGPPPLPPGVDTAEPFALPVPGRWANASDRAPHEAGVVLYAHGGGFEAGNPEFEHLMACRLSEAAGRPAFNVDYSLGPEHPFPAAHDEVISAYRALLAEGVPAGRMVLFGESAGATLVLETLLTLRAEGVPLPGAVVPVSPITDFTLTNPSIDAPAGRDVVGRKTLEHVVGRYLNGLPNDQAPQSPIHGDLAGLPRMLLVAGGAEALLDDSRCYAEAAAQAGVEVTLDVYEGMPHGFHLTVLSDPRPPVAATFLERLSSWLDQDR